MNEFTVVELLFKMIRERKTGLEEVLLTGLVSDFTEFKAVRARVNELALLEQDLKDLLKKVYNDSTGTGLSG